MSNAEEEFVTVAEAARQMGVDARQVRRYLPRLSATDTAEDTQRTHKGQPIVLVRVSALQSLRGNGSPANHEEKSKDSGNGQDRTHQRTGQDVSFAVAVAQVEELRARVADLSAALEHEREAHRRAETLHLGTMGELAELRRRASELEAVNLKLIEALPPSRDTAQEARQSTDTNDTAPAAVSVPDAPETKRGLFARLFGR